MPEWRNGRRRRLKIFCPKGRVGSNPTSGTKIYAGVMEQAYMEVSKTSAERHVGSTPTTRTIF